MCSPITCLFIYNFDFMYFACKLCLCTMFMPDAHGGQKRVLSPLKLELQTVASWHMGAGNGAWFLWKSSQHSLPLSYFSSCMHSYLWPSVPRLSYLFLEGQKITEESSHQAHSLPEVRLELLSRSCRESHSQDVLKANGFGVFLTVVCEHWGKQSGLPAMEAWGTKPKARNGPD